MSEDLRVQMLQGHIVVAGAAHGRILYSMEPLSFWGGYDYHTGEVIDRRHPLSGEIAAGCILCLPATRGSSTTTAVLLEAVKAGTAPAAIVTTGVDTFFALASHRRRRALCTADSADGSAAAGVCLAADRRHCGIEGRRAAAYHTSVICSAPFCCTGSQSNTRWI